MVIEDNYSENYKVVMALLEKKASESNFDRDEIKRELESLYNYEGLGWAGRGMIKDAEISASIAAYEAFLGKITNENKSRSK